MNGWHDVDVQIEDGHVVAHGERDRPSAWGVIAAVVAMVPEGGGMVTLTATDNTGTHTACGPLPPFRRWSSANDDLEKEIAFTLASMTWKVDGVSIMTRAHTEKVYAYRAVEALNPALPVATALRTLRRLLDASRAIGSDDLATATAAALRVRREIATGGSSTISVDRVVNAFDRWLLTDLPEIRSSW